MLCFCNTSIAIALTKAQKRANAMFNESEKGDDESKRTNHLMLRKFGKKKLDKPNMSSSSDSEDEFKSNNEINQKSVKFQPEQIKRDKHRKETLASES
jgi:stress response protein YsnF